MSLAHKATKIGKLGIIYIVGTIVPLLIGIVVLPILTRYLNPEQYGIVALARQMMSLLGILIQVGLLHSLTSHYFRTDEHKRPELVKTVIQGMTVQMLLLCVLLSIAGIWIAKTLLPNLPLSSTFVYLLWLMVVWQCFFNAIISAGMQVAQFNEKAVWSVGCNLFNYLLSTGFGLVFIVLFGWRGFGRQGTVLMGTAIASVFAIWVLRKYTGGHFNFSVFKRVFKTGLAFVPHSCSGILAMSANVWLLNKLVSTKVLGIYGVAIFFGQLIQLPLGAFSKAAFPTQAKLMKEGTPEAKWQQTKLYTLLIMGISVLALGVSLFAPVAIKILAAPEYHEAMNVVPILVFAWMIHGFYWVASSPVFFFGGGLWLALATVSSITVSIILMFYLAPVYGMYGAAMSMVGCFLTRLIVIFFVSKRMYPLPWQYSVIFRIVLVLGLLVGLDIWLSPKIGFLFGIGAKTAIFLSMPVCLWLLRVIKTYEIVWARGIVMSKIKSFRNKRPQ